MRVPVGLLISAVAIGLLSFAPLHADELPQIGGQWSGNVRYRFDGKDHVATIALLITQRGSQLSGMSTAREGGREFPAESLIGHIRGNSVTITIGRGSDALILTGTILGPKATGLAGVARVGGSSQGVGTWNLTR